MNDDEVRIFLYLYLNGWSTTTTIARDVFDVSSVDDLRNVDRRVRYYLNKWIKEGVVEVREVDGKKLFRLSDNVHVGLASITMVSEDKEISIGLGRTMLVITPTGVHVEILPE